MATKFSEKTMLSLLNGIKLPVNEDVVKMLAVDILETEPYEKNGNRYLNNRFNPVQLEGQYFNVSITVYVTPKQAEKIEDLAKTAVAEHKRQQAIQAIMSLGFTEAQAIAMVDKKKGK
jgi:hypothetical protein